MDLTTLTARWTLDRLPSSELPGLAAKLLGAGYDAPALRRLAGEFQSPMADVGPLFNKVLAELGVDLPSREDAVRILARDSAERILSGAVSPYDGAQEIWQLSLELKGHNHQYDRFVYCASEYDDAVNPSLRQAFEHDIREAAEVLLRESRAA